MDYKKNFENRTEELIKWMCNYFNAYPGQKSRIRKIVYQHYETFINRLEKVDEKFVQRCQEFEEKLVRDMAYKAGELMDREAEKLILTKEKFDEIASAYAMKHGVPVELVLQTYKKTRKTEVVQARHALWRYCYVNFKTSLKTLADWTNMDDHTSVLHAVQSEKRRSARIKRMYEKYRQRNPLNNTHISTAV